MPTIASMLPSTGICWTRRVSVVPESVTGVPNHWKNPNSPNDFPCSDTARTISQVGGWFWMPFSGSVLQSTVRRSASWKPSS